MQVSMTRRMKLHTPITPLYPAKENLNASYEEEEEECTRWVRGFLIMLMRCIRHYEIGHNLAYKGME